VRRPFEQVDGWIEVPDEPGLGVEVDESVVRKYAFE
jgi:L-alanine-DL-glutamate epimerase-like enolase superfamily enzyme